MTRARAHVFVFRGSDVLVLRQTGGTRWWETPGGELNEGESATEAALRETLEETGLSLSSLDQLREWHYVNRAGEGVRCFAFAGESYEGEVRLSEEHTESRWISPHTYSQEACGEELGARLNDWRTRFLAEMRENCRLADRWARARSGD